MHALEEGKMVADAAIMGQIVVSPGKKGWWRPYLASFRASFPVGLG
jgi:hypothetical protein